MIKRTNSILVFLGNDYSTKENTSEEIILWAEKLASKTNSLINIALIGNSDYINKTKNKFLNIPSINIIYTAATDPVRHFDDKLYADFFYNIAKQANPDIALTLATEIGRAFFPRVAARLNTGLTADCTSLAIKQHNCLIQTRPAYGGNLMADIICQTTRPQMATIRPGQIKGKIFINKQHTATCIDMTNSLETITPSVPVIKTENNATFASLSEAEIVIGVGKGIIKKENIKIIEELALLLKASIGATRACIESGWFPYEKQIGLTGSTIKPKLYIACGISGTVQHMAGIIDAKKIIAINKDKNAPIFNYADIAITEDMFDFLPNLITQLKNS